jgi:DNA polymerase III epsilon subunit family exonuclease
VRSDQVRVAIDLETTGLRPDQDAIIEIGAVKFAGPRIIDTYQTFVSLSGPLPYRIQRLTGIVPADLRRAPPLTNLLPVLRAFIGNAPLVGHSVAFDAAFLRRAGVAERNQLIDTYELASILLPSLPSYTLSAVGAALDVSSSILHRALADADLARAVLLALLKRLDDLDTPALETLAALPAAPDWTPGALLRAQASARQEAVSASPFAILLTDANSASFAARGLDPALATMAVARDEKLDTADLLTNSAVGAPSTQHDKPGPQAAALRAFLAEGGALLCELERKDEALRAALREVLVWVNTQSEARVLIAAVDSAEMLRIARESLPRAAVGITPAPAIAEIGESADYLCLCRWFGAARAPQAGVFPTEVTRGLARLTVWAAATRTGLRADVALQGSEEAAWERVRYGAEFASLDDDCPYRAAGYSFAAQAEARAANASIVVTSHAALASALANADVSRAELLAGARVIILDGRQFEDALRLAQTATLEPLPLYGLLDTLAAPTGSDLFGAVAALLTPTKPVRQSAKVPAAERADAPWRAAVARARQASRAFFRAVRQALQEAQEEQAHGKRSEQRDNGAVRLDFAARDSSAWESVMSAWSRLSACLADTVSVAHAAVGALPGESALARGLRLDLSGAAKRLDAFRARGAELIASEDERAVTWIRPPYTPFADQNHTINASNNSNPRGQRASRPDEKDLKPTSDASAMIATKPRMDTSDVANEIEEAPTLSRIPIRVGQALQPLWSDERGVALLDWSLAVGGDFEAARNALALPETTRQVALTPDYSQQTLLLLPDDAAEPNAPGAPAQLESLIVALAQALDGDVVAVFPSHAMLRGAANGIRRALERHDIMTLAQGVDGSARQLWQNFDSQERVVLLGAGSFWDGGVRRGRAPACVIIARTPFPPLSDPIIATRAEAWSDPQNQYITPQGALKLRQALGGLAWSHSRRNAVILFDRRLQTRGYGPTILGALPEMTQYVGPLRALPERVAAWVQDK